MMIFRVIEILACDSLSITSKTIRRRDGFSKRAVNKNKILYFKPFICPAPTQVICLIIISNKGAEEKKTIFMK